MSRCKICEIKYTDDKSVFWNEKEIAHGAWTALRAGRDGKGIFLLAVGDDSATYRPKFCPNCGKDLRTKNQINSNKSNRGRI